MVKQKAPDKIKVYDICSLAGTQHLQEDIIAEPLGGYLNRHPDLHFPHRHSFYHVVYFSKGGGTHTIDFETFPVKAGQIYFMIPGQVHTWSFKSDVDGYIINCSASLLNAFAREGQYVEQFPFFSGVAADGVLQVKDRKLVEHSMLDVIDEAKKKDAYSRDMISIKLLALFIAIARDSGHNKTPSIAGNNQILLQHFRKLVEQHYHAKRLPKEYAALLYITPNHLNALCADILGRTAGELIRDRVLLEAKRMLVSGAGNIADIAWQLDFKDNAYFSRFFRKYTGTSPEDFRKQAVENLK